MGSTQRIRWVAATAVLALAITACGQRTPSTGTTAPPLDATTRDATAPADTTGQATQAPPASTTGTATASPTEQQPPPPDASPLPERPLVWVVSASGQRFAVLDGGGRLVGERAVPGPDPATATLAFDRLWVGYGGGVAGFNPENGALATDIAIDGNVVLLAAGESELFVVAGQGGELNQVDPVTEQVLATAPIEPEPSGIVVLDGRVWLIDFFQGLLQTFDEATLEPGPVYEVGAQPMGLAFANGALWTASSQDGTVVRIDPANGRTESFEVGGGPTAIEALDGQLFVVDQRGGRLLRVDAANGQITGEVPVGFIVTDLAIGAGSVWVVRQDSGTVLRIDPGSMEVVAEIVVGGTTPALTVG